MLLLLRRRGGGVAYYLRDTFAGTNGTSLPAHTMEVGAGWTNLTGTWQIQSNRATPATLVSTAARTTVAGNTQSDYWAQVTFRFSNLTGVTPTCGLNVRYADLNNRWSIGLSGSSLFLSELVGGSSTLRKNYAFTPSINTDYVVRVKCKGSRILVWLNGVLRLVWNTATSSQTATGIALTYSEPSSSIVATFDDFSVTPIGNVPLNLIWDGDSIYKGTHASSAAFTIPALTVARLNALGIYPASSINLAVPGQTLTNMRADASSEVYPLLTDPYANNLLVVMGGTNDLVEGGLTAAAIEGRAWNYTDPARAAGFTVIAATLPPRSDIPTEPLRTNANTLIRANWASHADALSDYGGDGRIGDIGDELGPLYDGDACHPNDAGNAVFAELAAASIVSML